MRLNIGRILEFCTLFGRRDASVLWDYVIIFFSMELAMANSAKPRFRSIFLNPMRLFPKELILKENIVSKIFNCKYFQLVKLVFRSQTQGYNKPESNSEDTNLPFIPRSGRLYKGLGSFYRDLRSSRSRYLMYSRIDS